MKKILIFALYAICGVILIYLLIDSGSASDVLSMYASVKPQSSASQGKQLQFLRSYSLQTNDFSVASRILGISADDAKNSLGGNQGSGGSNENIPSNLSDLLNMLLACGIKSNSGDANCNKVFKILYPNTNETYSSLKSWSSTTESKIKSLNNQNLVDVQVQVWQYSSYNPTSPNVGNNFKEEKTMTVQCSKTLEPIVKQIFKEIHDSPDKPVIMYAGGLCVRKMNNNSGTNTTSTHSYGGTIDINASVGSTQVYWNWNGGRNTTNKPYPVSKDNWDKLEENQYKYLCLYEGCTIVRTFEKYGYYWGGSWSKDSCDPMHFSVFNH